MIEGVCYYPNFITEFEEEYFINKILQASRFKWTVLSNRRLQCWGNYAGERDDDCD